MRNHYHLVFGVDSAGTGHKAKEPSGETGAGRALEAGDHPFDQADSRARALGEAQGREDPSPQFPEWRPGRDFTNATGHLMK